MNEDTLLDQNMAEAIILLREAAKIHRPAPASSSQPPKSPRLIRLLANFRKQLEDEHGTCFRTEVRNSGIFICGIHQSTIWAKNLKDCPQLARTLEIFEAVVAKEISLLEADLEAQKSTTDSRRWPTPDRPSTSWGSASLGEDPDVTKFDFWANLMDEDELG